MFRMLIGETFHDIKQFDIQEAEFDHLRKSNNAVQTVKTLN